ncbi:MAG: AAA family ATPase, partial [Planctomycetota bacterium]
MSQTEDSQALEERAEQLGRRVQVLREEISTAILGQDQLVYDLLTGLLAGGHVLLEGLPGLGKTLLVKSLAQCLGLGFSRIQFTPDLMPGDITGTRVVEDQAGSLEFRFQKGPLFSNLVLADEINRTTPKTQSALLEAMQEHSVTVGDKTHPLPQPFTVVATQNPIELEGTFPLPEAQLDRFLFHLLVPTPNLDEMVEILDATTGKPAADLRVVFSGDEIIEFKAIVRQVICGRHLLQYVAQLLRATDPRQQASSEETKRL